jgi:hypothetical protein
MQSLKVRIQRPLAPRENSEKKCSTLSNNVSKKSSAYFVYFIYIIHEKIILPKMLGKYAFVQLAESHFAKATSR